MAFLPPIPLIIRKATVRRFLKSGAIDEEHAVNPSDIGVRQSFIFSRLLSRGKIIKTENNKYFVNTRKS